MIHAWRGFVRVWRATSHRDRGVSCVIVVLHQPGLRVLQLLLPFLTHLSSPPTGSGLDLGGAACLNRRSPTRRNSDDELLLAATGKVREDIVRFDLNTINPRASPRSRSSTAAARRAGAMSSRFKSVFFATESNFSCYARTARRLLSTSGAASFGMRVLEIAYRAEDGSTGPLRPARSRARRWCSSKRDARAASTLRCARATTQGRGRY